MSRNHIPLPGRPGRRSSRTSSPAPGGTDLLQAKAGGRKTHATRPGSTTNVKEVYDGGTATGDTFDDVKILVAKVNGVRIKANRN